MALVLKRSRLIPLAAIGGRWFSSFDEYNRLKVFICKEKECRNKGFYKPRELMDHFQKKHSSLSIFCKCGHGFGNALELEEHRRRCFFIYKGYKELLPFFGDFARIAPRNGKTPNNFLKWLAVVQGREDEGGEDEGREDEGGEDGGEGEGGGDAF